MTGGICHYLFLNLKNENVFEPVDYLCGKFINVSHVVAVTLLKIKLKLDLKGLGARGDSYTPMSSILTKGNNIAEAGDHSSTIKELEGQISQLYRSVKEANKHFWPALLNPGPHLTARPGMFMMGSVEEMQMVLPRSYYAWLETPGALDELKKVQIQQ